jgi:hypothetical protein
VIVDKRVADADLRAIQRSLLNRLAQGGFLDSLVAVPRTPGETPGAAVVAPVGAMLQEGAQGAIGVSSVEQQACRSVQPPVAMTEITLDPPVAIALHGSWLSRD